ncbi:hypothetical protein JKF63_01635 [Porcisia hertigi]|uniref:Uncharacterized protein n=1 Tax=Porcisia hertigi TaxID=2761500 RepID=A0A836I5C0_9TRYP|nr:hypothetical protein JKF63_01635 [Porcisia hertigi]
MKHTSLSRHVRVAPLSVIIVFLLVCSLLLPRALALPADVPDVGTAANSIGTPAARVGEHVTVFMCADSGDLSGTHELGALIRAMSDTQVLSLTYCQTAHMGYIRHADGHMVRSLAVTTGINYISTTLCTRSVLKLRHQHDYIYDAMVFIGTSSFSPMLGGWDPTNTSSYTALKVTEEEAIMRGEAATAGANVVPPAPPTASQLNFEDARTGAQVDRDGCSPHVPGEVTPLSLGSVCVTSTAYLIETGFCTEHTRHSQCSRPHCSTLSNEHDCETKVYFASDALARSIEAASHGKTWPDMPETVKKVQTRFWEANEAMEPTGEGKERHRVGPSGASFVKCAEATGNTIHIGAERDFLCREHTVQALKIAQRLLTERGQYEANTREPLTITNVACVRAMDSMGFLLSLTLDRTARDIPVAVVRSASNYDMYPMKKVYVPPAVWRSALASGKLTVSPSVAAAINAEGALHESTLAAYTWHQRPDFLSEAEYQEFAAASLQYALETATFVLSNYFFGGRSFA